MRRKPLILIKTKVGSSRRVELAHGRIALLLAVLLLLPGCVSDALAGFTGSLGTAILDNDDPETVRAGAPSYLLLIDALVDGEPTNATYLALSSQLHGAYGSAFVDEPERKVRFATKALVLAERALCAERADACGLRARQLPDIEAWLGTAAADDVPRVYGLAVAWAGYIQASSEDWNAVAELSRVQRLMSWVAATTPAHDQGGAHLYLGVMASLVPAAMGGQPEASRAHFEKAVELSGGRHLMTKVMFARSYARSVYDRELHDRLLNEVLAADPHVPGQTLVNVIAQREAKALLASADEYF